MMKSPNGCSRSNNSSEIDEKSNNKWHTNRNAHFELKVTHNRTSSPRLVFIVRFVLMHVVPLSEMEKSRTIRTNTFSAHKNDTSAQQQTTYQPNKNKNIQHKRTPNVCKIVWQSKNTTTPPTTTQFPKQ